MSLIIKNYEIPMFLGVYDWEKRFATRVLINLNIEFWEKRFALHRSLENLINYDILLTRLNGLFYMAHYEFLEDVADALALELKKEVLLLKCEFSIAKLGTHRNIEYVAISKSFNRGWLYKFKLLFCSLTNTRM